MQYQKDNKKKPWNKWKLLSSETNNLTKKEKKIYWFEDALEFLIEIRYSDLLISMFKVLFI